MKIKISDIIIKKRIREDIGDILELSESMKKNGLIHPITVSDVKELITGFRRIEAAKALGWEEIECRIITVKSELEKLNIETDENLVRKDFTREEIVKIEEVRKYLSATGLEKFILWLKKLIKRLMLWIREMMPYKN